MKARPEFRTSFLRSRRIELGLEPCEVARLAGLSPNSYRQIECRGRLPEEHIPVLAAVLQVPEETLWAERFAVMLEATLGIPKGETRTFIARALHERASSRQQPVLHQT